MSAIAKDLKNEFSLIPTENLSQVYGYSELNHKLFDALFIDCGPHQRNFLDQHLPLHFVKVQAYFGTVQRLVHNEDRTLMRLENTPHSGIPFLLIKSKSEKIHLVNPMNYTDEYLTVQEASLTMNIFIYNYFYEMAKTKIEQKFAIFMMEYLKRMADNNYSSDEETNKPKNNVVGIFALID